MDDAVLLTGATGFVGRAILDALVARGVRVHAVARRPGPPREGVVWHACDLLDPLQREALFRQPVPPTLVHAAWYVEHGRFWTSGLNADWHRASVDLARGYLARGGKTVLAVGTCAEYARYLDGPEPWPESRPIAPDTAYGKAKAALHRDLTDLCQAAGARLVWVRLFHLTGPGEDSRRFVPSILGALRAGQRATVRAPGLIRDISTTAHVADCLSRLLSARAEGVFNIGSGQARSLGDLARSLAVQAGRPDLLELLAGQQPDEPVWMVPDLTRLRQTIGDWA